MPISVAITATILTVIFLIVLWSLVLLKPIEETNIENIKTNTPILSTIYTNQDPIFIEYSEQMQLADKKNIILTRGSFITFTVDFTTNPITYHEVSRYIK